MKYKKNERVYVHHHHQVCEATILDWHVDHPLRGPAEIHYHVHIRYLIDRLVQVWMEEDVWVEDSAVMKHALWVDEKKVHNIVKRKKEYLHNLANEIEGKGRAANPYAALLKDPDGLKKAVRTRSGYDDLADWVGRCCRFQGVECPESVMKDLRDFEETCDLFAGSIATPGGDDQGRQQPEDPEKASAPAVVAADREKVASVLDTRILEGRIYLFSVFVSEHCGPTKNQKRWFGRLEDAEKWIESLAAAHGREVEFINGSAGLKGEPAHCRMPGDYYHQLPREASAEEVLSSTELRSWVNVSFLSKKEGCDRFAILILADAPGCSYAQSRCSAIYLGDIFLFGKGGGSRLDLTSGTIAQVILFLFGAEGLFVDKDEPDSDLKRKARALWPEDVMLNPFKPLKELSICPYTASKIGWVDEKDVWGNADSAE